MSDSDYQEKNLRNLAKIAGGKRPLSMIYFRGKNSCLFHCVFGYLPLPFYLLLRDKVGPMAEGPRGVPALRVARPSALTRETTKPPDGPNKSTQNTLEVRRLVLVGLDG